MEIVGVQKIKKMIDDDFEKIDEILDCFENLGAEDFEKSKMKKPMKMNFDADVVADADGVWIFACRDLENAREGLVI